jgi:predicted nucleic acid-binding protein
MKTYVDANLLVRLFLQLPGHVEALEQIGDASDDFDAPLPMTDLLRFEVVNAVHRMVFESRAGGQWRVTPEAAAIGLADYEDHIARGVRLRCVPLTLADIEPEFISLAARYTAKHGFRTYDIIHVASAITLRCRRFLSFDAKAIKLAKLAGLETN